MNPPIKNIGKIRDNTVSVDVLTACETKLSLKKYNTIEKNNNNIPTINAGIFIVILK